jgi:hypothetical protein
MNYATLVQQIQDYLENSEASFVTAIPDIVKNAEWRIHYDLQLPAARKNKTTTTTTSNRYLGTPPDFVSAFEASVVSGTTYNPLVFVDVSYIREAYPDASVTGLPQHYAIWNETTFLLGPTPDSNYSVELHYFGLPESIVTAGTTWISENAPAPLLYACLIEGYVYNKGEADMLNVYNTRYKENIDLLKVTSAARVRGDAYRDGQFKVPVQK